VAGYVYFIIGSLLTVLLFKPMVAVLSMLMLCLGDAASAIIGSVLQGSNVRDIAPGAARRSKPLAVQAGMLTAWRDHRLLIRRDHSASAGSLPCRGDWRYGC